MAACDICVVTTIHAPLDVRIYQRELSSLVEQDFAVSLISPWEQPDGSIPMVKWVSLPAPQRRWDRIAHGARTFRAALSMRARSYLFHDLDFLPWAILLRWLKRVPVVYDCHENYPEEVLYGKAWIPGRLRGILAAAVRIVENWAVRYLDATVAVVPSQVERFSRLGARCVLVRNFANWDARPDLQHERALLYSGSLSEDYGAFLLLDIGRELRCQAPDFPLVVADRFGIDQELRRHFVETVEREELPIHLVPEVPSTQLDRLLSRGCIGLSVAQDVPNKRMAYPTKVFEYMAMGLPVVASDLPLTREIVDAAGCGVLVPAGDAKAYVEAALALLHDREAFERCRMNGFAASQKMYHWRLEAARLADLFRDLLGNAGALSPSFKEAPTE